MTDNKFKVGDDEVLIYSNYMNILKQELFTANKDDIVIKYSSIDCIIHEKRGYLGLIFLGIISILFGITALAENSDTISIFLFLFGMICTISYFITLGQKIIIKTPSHKEIIKYDQDLFHEILKKLE